MDSFLEFFKSIDDKKMSKEKKKQKRKDSKGRYDRGLRAGDGGLAEAIGSAQSPATFTADQNALSRISITRVEDEEDLPMDDEMDMDDEVATDDEDYMDDEYEDPEDPNKMGTIRVIKGAHLVYKREDEGGSFEELWIYRTKDGSKEDIEVRRDILAGTDIPTNKKKSKDGTQSFTLWTVGNVQYLNILGLPN